MMKKLFYILIFIVSVQCTPRIEIIEWKAVNYESFTDIKSGVPVYNKSSVDYCQGEKKVLEVTIDEPAVISVAENLQDWGYFQFPNIYQTKSGELVAKWHLSPDAVSSYGNNIAGYAKSQDQGKNWELLRSDSSLNILSGILLSNGDRIKNYTPKALKLNELGLPEAVDTSVRKDGRTLIFYKLNELPKQLQGVYINRLK